MNGGAPVDARAPSAARSWPRALGLAAAALYVPQLLPLALTDLPQHGHCLADYGRLFPLLTGVAPGVRARIASGLGEPREELVFYGAAAAVALALLAGAALALRRWRRLGVGVAAGVALASAALSMAAVAVLRA